MQRHNFPTNMKYILKMKINWFLVCVCRDNFTQHLLRRVGNSFVFNLVRVPFDKPESRIIYERRKGKQLFPQNSC